MLNKIATYLIFLRPTLFIASSQAIPILPGQTLIFFETSSASASAKGWATGLSQSQKSHSPSPVNAVRQDSGPGKETNEEDAFLTTLAQPTLVKLSCY